MPLLFRHFDSPRVKVITADDRNMDIATKYGVSHHIIVLTPDNLVQTLDTHVCDGDFIVNLTVDVDCLEVMKWCAQHNVLYLDTVVEPWAGYYTDPNLPVHERSNYFLRQRVLDHRAGLPSRQGPTAIIAHGANPGLVNHFVKEGLLEIAKKVAQKTAAAATAVDTVVTVPTTRQEWVDLAAKLGVKVIHIAERDTQASSVPKKRDEFVNTWSVEGFIAEGSQPSELGWGSHETELPEDAMTHPSGCGAAIYLKRAGLETRVRSWTPDEGSYHGWIITHNEAISIADYFSGTTTKDGTFYRPTCHYAYHPCDAAVASMHEISGKNYVPQTHQRIITDEVVDGVDELGVLLMGSEVGSLWYGSNLSITQARELAPHNNATSLQVVGPIIAAMMWAIRNPNQGILEADELPHHEILTPSLPYLGTMVSAWTDWTPLQGRSNLFAEFTKPLGIDDVPTPHTGSVSGSGSGSMNLVSRFSSYPCKEEKGSDNEEDEHLVVSTLTNREKDKEKAVMVDPWQFKHFRVV